MQDLFIIIKSHLGIFLASFSKTRWPPRAFISTFSKDFWWPSRAKGIIGRDLKFAGYVPHYKILIGNIFGLILKNKMAATGVSLSVMKSAYISLIIGPRVIGWESSGVVRFDLGPRLLGQSRMAKLKMLITRLLLVLEVWDGRPTYRKSWAGNLLVWSDLT